MCFDEDYRSNIEQKAFDEARLKKIAGAKIIGVYCSFTPKELIAAAGAIPVSLCAGSERPIEAAHSHLPGNLCPLIKSSYGHALSDTYPYFHAADFLLADSTCDGKIKMFELLGRIKPLHLINLPRSCEGEFNHKFWKDELLRLKDVIEAVTGNLITKDTLKKEIALHNAYRKKKLELYEMNTGEFPLVTGKEIDSITWPTMFDVNLEERIIEIDSAIGILKQRAFNARYINSMAGKPRILLTGCPTTNNKVSDIIEDAGGVIVAMENCGGLKTLSYMVDEYGDPIEALAKRYLSIPCSCLTPNHGRFELMSNIIRRYKIDGVIDLTWEACHTYNVEAFFVREHVQEKLGIPYMQVRTDYSVNDTGQIKTRVEAFIEVISTGKTDDKNHTSFKRSKNENNKTDGFPVHITKHSEPVVSSAVI